MPGTTPVGSFALTNVATQSSTNWTSFIDGNWAVAERDADAFAPKPNSPSAMNVLIDAGFIDAAQPNGLQVITEVAAQGPLTISAAPSPPNNRIDLIVIDAGTGVASVITGTPATSPVAPALTAGKRQIAQVSVPNGTVSIGSSNITDLRAVWGQYARGVPWVAASGTADAITGTYTPANSSLYDGLILGFRATAANATTTPTFNADGLGAKTITKKGGAAVSAGDIPGANAEVLVRYNLANTRWELLNPAPRGPITTINTSNTTPATALDGAINNYTGAGANHEWDLPAGVPGMFLGFQLPDSTHSMTIRPNGSDVIAAKSVWSNGTPLVIPATSNGTTAIIYLAFRGSTGWEVASIHPLIARSLGWGTGVAQIISSETGAVATGTTAIPFDNTVPQQTEGDQYLSATITPFNASSTLEIDVLLNGAINSTSDVFVGALFQDSGANAIAVGFTDSAFSASAPGQVKIHHAMAAGTTSATIFKVRAGGQTGATLTLNGASGGQLFGGTLLSSITIKEILP